MKEAANELGVSVGLVKCAKVKNCDAFMTSGRIIKDKLIKFIEEHRQELEEAEDESLTKWKVLLTKSNALIAEKELEELQGKYILREEAEKEIRAIALAQKAMLRSRLVQELPQKLVGMTVPQMVVVMEDTLNDICELMNRLKVDE